MPISKVLGSRLRLIRADDKANQKSQVIVFAHGGTTTGKTFSNKGGPIVQFYCPEGESLYAAHTYHLKNFKVWSDRAKRKYPAWTISGGDVPDYYLFKIDGHHLGYDREGWGPNVYPSQQPDYLTKNNIESVLQETLKEYDIVLVRARNTQHNRKDIKLSEVVEKLKSNGYGHGVVHCWHCRGKPRFYFEKELTPSMPVNNPKAFAEIDLMDLVDFGENISFGERENI